LRGCPQFFYFQAVAGSPLAAALFVSFFRY